jgi:PAS domain S-box-containing protein
MFGYESAAVVGQPVEMLMTDDARVAHVQGMHRRAEGIRGPAAGRWTPRTALRADGSTFPVEIFIAEVSRADDRRILALVRDMTEHVAVQEMKDDFVSVVSHELRTPLTAIQGALGLLLGGAAGEIDPRSRELIEVAHANARRLVRLTNDLLDLQKVEAGRMTYRVVVGEISEIAERTIASMEPLAADKGVRLTLDRPKAGLFAAVDPDRIAQVLTNLLGNAIAVSDDGSVIEVRVLEEPEMARIEVQDHGPGIAQEDRERIWEKFVRAGSGAAARTQGTGIGLPLARALVEAHGGTIDFDTSIGEGTTFRVRIPRRMGLG